MASGSSGRLQTASCVSLQTLSLMLSSKAHSNLMWAMRAVSLWEEPPSASRGWAMCNQEKAVLLFHTHVYLPPLGSPGRGSAQSRAWGKRRAGSSFLKAERCSTQPCPGTTARGVSEAGIKDGQIFSSLPKKQWAHLNIPSWVLKMFVCQTKKKRKKKWQLLICFVPAWKCIFHFKLNGF